MPALRARNARVPIDPDVRWAIFQRDGYACTGCGSRSDLTLDHVHAVSLGGSNDPSNLRTMCRSCNSAKGRASCQRGLRRCGRLAALELAHCASVSARFCCSRSAGSVLWPARQRRQRSRPTATAPTSRPSSRRRTSSLPTADPMTTRIGSTATATAGPARTAPVPVEPAVAGGEGRGGGAHPLRREISAIGPASLTSSTATRSRPVFTARPATCA